MKNKIKAKFSGIFKKRNKIIEETNFFVQEMKDLLTKYSASSWNRTMETFGKMEEQFDKELSELLTRIKSDNNEQAIIKDLLAVLKKDLEISQKGESSNNTERLVCNPLQRNKIIDKLENFISVAKPWISLRTVEKNFFSLDSDKKWGINFEGLDRYVGKKIFGYLPFSQKFLNRAAEIEIKKMVSFVNNLSLDIPQKNQNIEKKEKTR